nr:hypothetical protein [candidate division Zixibacteria bacterium]
MKTVTTDLQLQTIRPVWRVFLVITLVVTFLAGCHYNLKYPLTDRTIMQAASQKPLNVAVLILEDNRNDIEKVVSARKEAGGTDVGDYTYDRDFGNRVAEDISKMLVKHLEYSHAFDKITLGDKESSRLEQGMLDSLAAEHIDVVLTGEIGHFYGYYNQSFGRQMLFGGGLALGLGIPVAIMTTKTETKAYGFEEVKTNPLAISLATSTGLLLGSWIESTGKRKIEWHTQLDLQLINTMTGEVVWQGKAEVYEDDIKAMPGLNTATRKQEVAVNSLRMAINDLVVNLSKAEIIRN